MVSRTALFRLLALAILSVASFSFGLPVLDSHAQTAGARKSPPARVAPRDAVLGGYSMTLSEIWGLPEMPPAPKDFGPHFDYPAEGSWNGLPTHSPYPN